MEIEAIQELIRTDEQVRKEIQNVYDERTQLRQNIETEKKKLSDAAWADVNAKVDATKKELDEKIVADEQKNQAYYEDASQQIKAAYEACRRKWRQEIYDRVIGKEGSE